MAATTKYIRTETGAFECHICGDVKFRQNTMYYHMKKHTGETRYRCEDCDRPFISKGALAQHRLHIHNEGTAANELPANQPVAMAEESAAKPKITSEEETTPKGAPAVAMFECPCCTHTAKTKANMITHIGRKHGVGWIPAPEELCAGGPIECSKCEKHLGSRTAYYYHAVSCFSVPSTIDLSQYLTLKH
jgi:hypothetical protein